MKVLIFTFENQLSLFSILSILFQVSLALGWRHIRYASLIHIKQLQTTHERMGQVSRFYNKDCDLEEKEIRFGVTRKVSGKMYVSELGSQKAQKR